MAPFRGRNTSAAVSIPELAEFRARIRAVGDKELASEFKDVNQSVAQMVVSRARFRAEAQGAMAAKAAKTLRAVRSGRQAEVVLGGPKAPFAWGAEFGAYRDKLRVRKNTGGRAYIVRNESRRALARTIRRIEAQHNRNTGEATKVTGRVRGWNQFKEWRGNKEGAGYFLFPTIRASADDIAEAYGAGLDRVNAKAFPDQAA